MPQIIWKGPCLISISGSPYVPNQSIAASGQFDGNEVLCQLSRSGVGNCIINAGADCGSSSGSGDYMYAGMDQALDGASIPDNATVQRYRVYFIQTPVNPGDQTFIEWDYTTFPTWQFNLGNTHNITPNAGNWDNISGEFANYNCCVDSNVQGFISSLSGSSQWQVAANRHIRFNIPATCDQLVLEPQVIAEAAPDAPYNKNIMLVVDYQLNGSTGSSGSPTVYKRRYNVSFLHPATPL